MGYDVPAAIAYYRNSVLSQNKSRFPPHRSSVYASHNGSSYISLRYLIAEIETIGVFLALPFHEDLVPRS